MKTNSLARVVTIALASLLKTGRFALIAILASLLTACASNKGTLGQSFTPGASGAEVRNGGPITMNATTPVGEGLKAPGAVEVTSSTGTGPAGYAIASETEARWWAQNQVQRNIYFKRLPDGTIGFNSNTGTDVDIGADEFSIDPKTGAISGKGFKLKTTTSEPLRASNESLTAMKDVWMKLTDSQKELYIQQLKTQEAAGGVAGQFAGELLKVLLTN